MTENRKSSLETWSHFLIHLQISAIQDKLSQLNMQQQPERGEQEAKLQQDVGPSHFLLVSTLDAYISMKAVGKLARPPTTDTHLMLQMHVGIPCISVS